MTTATMNSRRTKMSYLGNRRNIAKSRAHTRKVLRDWDTELVEAAVLIVSELATNAIRYTASGDGGTYEILLAEHADSITVHCHDLAGTLCEPNFNLPRDSATRDDGRGLLICCNYSTAWATTWCEHWKNQGRCIRFTIAGEPS